MLPKAEVAGRLILNDQSDVELGGGKAFSGVINGNPAAHIWNAPPFRTALARFSISLL
jgi:hypothetical protein